MLREIWYRLTTWAQRDRLDAEVAEEMQTHAEFLARDLERGGLAPEEAMAAAVRQVGHRIGQRDASRDAWGFPSIDAILQDIRYAIRGCRRQPAFTVGVVITLGLGVGANAAMFGIVDRVMLRPPPYLSAPERTHHLYLVRTVNGAERIGQSSPYQRYLELKGATGSMEELAAYAPRTLAIGSAERIQEARIGAASASFWNLFNARPAIGRFFGPGEDDAIDGARVIVLSYAFWQSQYGGSTSVLGTQIRILPATYTVIGVAPKGFGGVDLQRTDAFIPIGVAAMDDFGAAWATERSAYNMTWLDLYGRRRPRVSVREAEAELTAAYERSYRREQSIAPRTAPVEITKPRIQLRSVLPERGPTPSGPARVSVWLLGVAAIVLLVACANVGNLMLARGLARRREIAVRVALGVSRGRLIRQLIVENTVLAALGLVVGFIIAQWGGSLLSRFLMPGVEWGSTLVDVRVLVVAGVSSLLAVMLAGLAPIFQAGRSDLATTLRAARTGFQRSRVRNALLLTQAALSVVLLIGAGSFIRSVQEAGRARLGFDAERLLQVQVRMRSTAMDTAQQVELRRALLRAALSNPVVEGATLAYSTPLSGTRSGSVFVDGIDSTARFGEFYEQAASPGYFATVGTRILRGRGITAEDHAGATPVVVVSEAVARALWPDGRALGQCLRRRSPTAPCRTVIGVAENVRLAGLDDDEGLVSYYPALQVGENTSRMFVRVRGHAATQVETVRRDLQATMPQSGYVVVQPMTRFVSSARRGYELGATMFTVFGGLALILAAIGLYSVIAYGVAQRSHEISIRIAVGARSADVVRLVSRDALRIAAAGTVVGTAMALLAAPWIASLLYQTSPSDPAILALVATTLFAVALGASVVPSVRASRVDPAVAMRAD